MEEVLVLNHRANLYEYNNKKTLDEVAELEKELFWTEAWSLEQFKESLKASHYELICFKNDNMLVSYALVQVLFEEAELLRLGTKKEQQKKGQATFLLTFVLDFLKNKGVQNCSLEVREKNHIARLLYEKLGFQHYYTRPHYYQNPQDSAFLYRRNL